MKYLFLFLAFICAGFTACVTIKDGKPSIKQGVYGRVLWVEGNQMPSPDAPSSGVGKPITREIRIYELTTANQVAGNAPLYTSIRTTLVAKAKSNSDGYFQCKLKPGFYSVFVVEAENLFFANQFNGKGEIAVFEVKEGQLTRCDIKVNYKAVY